jgi:hypothetical protein
MAALASKKNASFAFTLVFWGERTEPLQGLYYFFLCVHQLRRGCRFAREALVPFNVFIWIAYKSIYIGHRAPIGAGAVKVTQGYSWQIPL